MVCVCFFMGFWVFPVFFSSIVWPNTQPNRKCSCQSSICAAPTAAASQRLAFHRAVLWHRFHRQHSPNSAHMCGGCVCVSVCSLEHRKLPTPYCTIYPVFLYQILGHHLYTAGGTHVEGKRSSARQYVDPLSTEGQMAMTMATTGTDGKRPKPFTAESL